MHKNLKIFTIVALLSATTMQVANAKTNVFACEPEWASLATEIGGDKVQAVSATTAKEDPHHVRAKPSLIAAMRKADIVVCSGASLEIGWLPILLQSAGNKDVQPGNIGFLQVADIVPVLEKPALIDRSLGDIHPEGNPHVQLNPHNIAIAAKELAQRLEQIDSANADYYKARYIAFDNKWQQAMIKWEKNAVSLNNISVVAHHKSFTYLIDWLNMKEAATLEAKPGLPPTTAHLEDLLKTMRIHPAKVIIRTSYEPSEASVWLSEKTAIKAVELPYTIGGNADSKDLFGLFDSTITILKGAVNVK